MFNKEKYIEFNKDKYDKIKQSIYNSLKDNNLDLEELYDFSFAKRLWKNIVDDSYENIWRDLIEYVKLIKEGTILEDGTLIAKIKKRQYSVPEDERSAWQIFKEQLKNKGYYSYEEIEGLEKSTIKILNNLSQDTNGEEAVKGLVMGYVQSGKTNSIESLMTMAADWGYNVFIVLSGIIENLRQQNLKRFENDIKLSRNSNIHWEFIENPNSHSTTAYKLLASKKAIVLVSLKNSKRLANVRDWLFGAGALSMSKAKILIIDDEADQAGLNTMDINDEERSKINALITDLVDNHTNEAGAVNYIGYTATPYGNFLNEVASIYPKDFIYMLPKSKKYIGSTEIFGYEELSGRKADGLDIIRNISNDDMKKLSLIENGNEIELPDSLKTSISWFICTLAYFRFKELKKPVTMLIHKNRKTTTQKELSDAITMWINSTNKDQLLELCKETYECESNRFKKQDFYEVMDDYGRDINDYPSFDELKPYINEIINIRVEHPQNVSDQIKYTRGIHAIIDNCIIAKLLDETEQPRLVYPDETSGVDFATGFIVIGGDTLSRGLTLEGLTTSYFCREVKTVDTLMQMGRWFGYRINYELMPRLWLDNKNIIKFEELTKVEYELRRDLEKYEIGVCPAECGPIITATYYTRITSKSKMQSAQTYEEDFSGVSSQTVLFDKDEQVHMNNIKLTKQFVDKFRFENAFNVSSNLLAMDINYKDIIDYLRQFKFCAESSFFNNINSFCDWLEDCEYDYLKEWNLILAGNGKISPTGEVGKVIRSKKIGHETRDYFSIGVLRNTRDIISDMDPKEYAIDMSSEKIMIETRSKYYKPQIIIYRIDGHGVPVQMTEQRVPIDMNTDIIGLYIYIPGSLYKNYTKSYQIRISKKEEEGNY